MKNWLFLLVAIVAEVVGTMCLKQSDGFRHLLPAVGVVIFYGIAFYFLSLTLRVIPIGVAYAIWAGVGVALIVIAGWVWFGQKLDTAAIIGILLIVAGVMVLNIFSKIVHY